MYYADVDLFINDAAKMYLDGISFKGYGDWVKTGQDEDGMTPMMTLAQGMTTSQKRTDCFMRLTYIFLRRIHD